MAFIRIGAVSGLAAVNALLGTGLLGTGLLGTGLLGTGLSGAGAAGAEEPVLHDVTYTLYTEKPFFAEIYYRDADPANFADYSHNPYLFSPNVEAELGPDRPWVLNVRLTNPDYWAMVLGTSGLSPNPPTFHCTLAVDGVVVSTNSGAKGALCALRNW